jgi:hypothetical protein
MPDLLVIYLGGWIVVATGVFVATAYFSDFRSPAPHPMGMSFVAGALWPLLLLGIAEFSSLALFARVQSKAEPETEVLV